MLQDELIEFRRVNFPSDMLISGILAQKEWLRGIMRSAQAQIDAYERAVGVPASLRIIHEKAKIAGRVCKDIFDHLDDDETS